jgi:glycosyltransferase involved in cell wall biosynthesis
MTKYKFTFVYLGRRGGGNKLLLDLLTNLEDSSNCTFDFLISNRNEKAIDLASNSRVKILIANSIFRLIIESMRIAIKNRGIYIFLMQHPHDYPLWIFSRLANRFRIIMVHDSKRHKGDKYPATFSLKARAKNADARIFFSEYVRSRYPRNEHDFVWRHYQGINADRDMPDKGYILTIGRLRKYQGVSSIPIIAKLIESKFPLWIIAGNSKIAKDYTDDRIMFLNKWLSDEEIKSLIGHASVVVLPYSEASQSGIVPMVSELGVPLVVTPVGGLPEQVSGIRNAFLSNGFSPEAIAQAVDKALNFDQSIVKECIVEPLSNDYTILIEEAISLSERKK